MQNAIVWLNVLSFAIMTIALTLGAIVYMRRRFLWMRWYLLYQGAYAAWLFVLTYHFSMDFYSGTASIVLDTGVAILRLAASGLIILAYPYLILRLRPEEPGSALRYLIAGIAAVLVAAGGMLAFLGARPFAQGLINVLFNSYLLGFTVFGLIVLSRRRRGLERTLMMPFLWLSFAFYLYAVAAGSLLVALRLPSWVLNALSASLYCLPWSLAVTLLLFRHLALAESDAGLPADFVAEHSITPREQEMILQVIQGLSNRRIADRSFVSLKTVESHLYNVFRKCSVKNRVELVRKVQSYR
jgi:DNA-binding CsgD family transcriptional regulator